MDKLILHMCELKYPARCEHRNKVVSEYGDFAFCQRFKIHASGAMERVKCEYATEVEVKRSKP